MKYSVIVNVNLEFIVDAKSEEEALEAVENVELPKEYVSESFEVIKLGKIKKDGYADYVDF